MRSKLLTAGLGLALTISSVGMIGVPAGAQTTGSTRTQPAQPAQPVVVEPNRPDSAKPRPVRPPQLEVLTLACTERDVDTTDHAIGCQWRSSTRDDAVGYQLWRIVDHNGRELVWRGGLDTTMARDSVSGRARSSLYVVLALDSDGDIVGQSRPSVIRFDPIDPTDATDPVDAADAVKRPNVVAPAAVDTAVVNGSVSPVWVSSYRHIF